MPETGVRRDDEKKTRKSHLCCRCWNVVVRAEKPKKPKARKPKAGR